MSTNRLIALSPRLLAFLFVFFTANTVSPPAFGQQRPIAAWLETCRGTTKFEQVSLFQPVARRSGPHAAVAGASLLALDPAGAAALFAAPPAAMAFSIPTAEGQPLELELAQVEIEAPGFSVRTDLLDQVPVPKASHYRGTLRGKPNSIACLSLSSSGLMGMVADETGTYQLALLEDGSENYIFYPAQSLKAASPHTCFSDEDALVGDDGESPAAGERGVGCKTVEVYFECDYKLFTDKGSNVANVSNYVTGLFNQVAALYANDNLGIVISQVYVWTTADPYMGYSSTSAVLNAFRQTRGTSFNGNLAHLLSTRSLGGGIAYVDVVCFKQYAFGVSAIQATYQNVPTYSWSVEVVTHELGHNLGSWHTQSCNWPNGALDNCVAPEGACAPGPTPQNGGTIMSYCHLTSHGINFNHGFGLVPGNHIRNKVLNATCVPQSGTVPAGLSTSNITQNSAVLNWNPVPGATSYTVQYKLSSAGTWTTAGNTAAATYSLTGLAANSAYQWQVKTDCSNYSPTAQFTTANGGGGGGNCNAPNNLTAINVTANSTTLTWNQVAGAGTYTVRYKLGSASAWTTLGSTSGTSLNLANLSPLTKYDWQVKANCSDWSATASFTTGNNGGGGGGSCSAPTNLLNKNVGPTYATISWNPVQGAANYSIQIKLANSSNWFSLGAVSVTTVVVSGLQANTTYHWRVKANCSDYSAIKVLTTLQSFGSGDGTEGFAQPFLTEAAPAPALSVFPNPASQQLNIRWENASAAENCRLLLTDLAGRAVMEQAFAPQVDVTALAPGIYMVALLEGGQRLATARLVKTAQ